MFIQFFLQIQLQAEIVFVVQYITDAEGVACLITIIYPIRFMWNGLKNFINGVDQNQPIKSVE